MEAQFHKENRRKVYDMLSPGSILVIFSGDELRKTNDEYYPFFAERNYVYLTGLANKQAVLMAAKDGEGQTSECLYILNNDPIAERWTGIRVKPQEAADISGIGEIRYREAFEEDFDRLAKSGNYGKLYLDLFHLDDTDLPRAPHRFAKKAEEQYPQLEIGDAVSFIRKIRLIKQPCEIEALRKAEEITKEGILAMMRASRPGMYEYQYKAEFDHALGQHGPVCHGFPPIISAGKNNFCIHYYSYTGQAQDGDMILNDVGVQYDNLITDVSRSWPCNGHFSERQKTLYNCALATSDYMFSIVKPGMKMKAVDETIREYNGELLRQAGVLKPDEDIRKLMWHGGAHHIGYDVHDVVETPDVIAPGMVFCIDVGIYNEDWGIGFRLEDNCLVTENGCENLSAGIPRRIEDLEAVMQG